MRNEATIRKEVERMRNSRYARFYAAKIAALEWALADCRSIRQREQECVAQFGKHHQPRDRATDE